MKSPINETTKYDNFLNKKEPTKNSVNRLFEDVDVENKKDSEKYWVGMPEFIQEEKKSFKTIYLHFRNEEDLKSLFPSIKIWIQIKSYQIKQSLCGILT